MEGLRSVEMADGRTEAGRDGRRGRANAIRPYEMGGGSGVDAFQEAGVLDELAEAEVATTDPLAGCFAE